MKNFNYFIIILLIIFPSGITYSQGCSDAGFCTVHNLKTGQNMDDDKEKLNRLKIGLSNGRADYSIGIWAAYLEYNRLVRDKLSFALKLAYNSQSKDSLSSSGLSDVYISTSYLGVEHVDFTVGLKLPLGNGNKKKNGLTLPMDYQPSLGSVDIIFGVGYAINRLKLTLAVQQPLTQNKNAFFQKIIPSTRSFPTSNRRIITIEKEMLYSGFHTASGIRIN